MNDKQNSHRPVDEAQTSMKEGMHYSGGDALLDAEVEAREQNEGDIVEGELKATNIASGDPDTDDPTDAKNFTTTGAYPAKANRMDDDRLS